MRDGFDPLCTFIVRLRHNGIRGVDKLQTKPMSIHTSLKSMIISYIGIATCLAIYANAIRIIHTDDEEKKN